MEERTHLYHCTSSEYLLKIIKSRQFHPSYCLETLSVLPEKMNMAYAVVCFADLLRGELSYHMTQFNANSYIRMKKDWALRSDVSPVVYYETNSLMSVLLKNIIQHCVCEHNNVDDLFYKNVNHLIGYLKQYKGKYYIKDKHEFSEETLFYTEREWRYYPMVYNYESPFLSEEQFKNKSYREEKKKELVDHGYALKFNWQDIEEIGIPKEDKHLLKNVIPCGWESAKVRLL